MAITSVGKTATVVSTPGAASSNNTAAMAVVTALFFMWGFVTCLNDILIPHLANIFDLNYKQQMLVQLFFFFGYFVFALPAGRIVEWIGYKRTMVVGLCTMALGALLFLPAAGVVSYSFFLAALTVIAAGMTALQVSANAYVSVLGSPETASSRLNLSQAFNSLGTTIAPFFGSILILGGTSVAIEQVRKMAPAARHAYELQQASTVKMPYILIALVLLALTLVIGFFKLPLISTHEEPTESGKPAHSARVWGQRHLILGVVAIFVYVGGEVAIGSFLVKYLSRPEIGNLTEKAAGTYISIYWGFAMAGRFIGSALLQRVRPAFVLGIAALIAFSLVGITMLTFGQVAVWSVLAIGLFNSIMFPTIFTLGIAGLGPLTGEGSGLLVMGIVGGALIPYVQGAIADKIGIHHAFILPLICYLYIAFYGFIGSKPKQTLVAA